MGAWSILTAVLLFALACNLDTVLLAVGYAAKGVRISSAHSLIIAAVTTAVTWLSLALGDTAARVLSPGLAGKLGGVVLVGHLARLESFGVAYLTPFAANAGEQTEGNAVFRQPLPRTKLRAAALKTPNRRNQG